LLSIFIFKAHMVLYAMFNGIKLLLKIKTYLRDLLACKN